MNFEEESKKALRITIEWDVEYKRPGAGTIHEQLPADSVPEAFTKSGFILAEGDSDFRAQKTAGYRISQSHENKIPGRRVD